MQCLTVALAMIAHVARQFENLTIIGIRLVVGDKPQMNADDVDLQLASKVGNRFKLGRAGSAGFAGHQADGPLDRWNIGIAFALKTSENTSDRNAEPGQPLVELGSPLRRA